MALWLGSQLEYKRQHMPRSCWQTSLTQVSLDMSTTSEECLESLVTSRIAGPDNPAKTMAVAWK